MTTETKKTVIKAGVTTPYLIGGFEGVLSPEEIMIHKDLGGYDPDYFSKVSCVETPRHRVLLDKECLCCPSLEAIRRKGLDLIIAGSARHPEKVVRSLKDSGLLIARYSIFYGGPSGYSGDLPEEAGYAFDIPKTVGSVQTMLTDDTTLAAIRSREECHIRDALAMLSERLPSPILVTPHLSKALEAAT